MQGHGKMDLSNYRGLRRYLAGDYNNPETLYKLAISRHQESGLFFFEKKQTNEMIILVHSAYLLYLIRYRGVDKFLGNYRYH